MSSKTNQIIPGRRIVGLEAVELAAQTGQDLWRCRPARMAESCIAAPDIATHAGEALQLIARNEARAVDFYTFEDA